VHHKLEELLDQYLETSGLRNQPNAPLFPIALGKTRKLGNRPATRKNMQQQFLFEADQQSQRVNETITLYSSPIHRLTALGPDALTEIDALSLLLDASDSHLAGQLLGEYGSLTGLSIPSKPPRRTGGPAWFSEGEPNRRFEIWKPPARKNRCFSMCRLLAAKKIGAVSVGKRKPRKGGEGESKGTNRVGLIFAR
jgi:hypothetical protein